MALERFLSHVWNCVSTGLAHVQNKRWRNAHGPRPRGNIRRAAMMKDGRLVGIVSDTDIFQAVEEGGWGPE